jgi:hypothetical protein
MNLNIHSGFAFVEPGFRSGFPSENVARTRRGRLCTGLQHTPYRGAGCLACRCGVLVKSPERRSSVIRRSSRCICCCFYAPRLFARRRWISPPAHLLNVAASAPDKLPLSPSSRPAPLHPLSHRAVVVSSLTQHLCASYEPRQQRQVFSRHGGMNQLTARFPLPPPRPGPHCWQLLEAASTARCEMLGGGHPTR